jgi:hypothetical protein
MSHIVLKLKKSIYRIMYHFIVSIFRLYIYLYRIVHQKISMAKGYTASIHLWLSLLALFTLCIFIPTLLVLCRWLTMYSIQAATYPPFFFYHILSHFRGPGSSAGIATDYGLDGPVIESRWGRDFPHLSRPALGPTQPPVQWVPGHSRG